VAAVGVLPRSGNCRSPNRFPWIEIHGYRQASLREEDSFKDGLQIKAAALAGLFPALVE
jgi:hypothetical protein